VASGFAVESIVPSGLTVASIVASGFASDQFRE